MQHPRSLWPFIVGIALCTSGCVMAHDTDESEPATEPVSDVEEIPVSNAPTVGWSSWDHDDVEIGDLDAEQWLDVDDKAEDPGDPHERW